MAPARCARRSPARAPPRRSLVADIVDNQPVDFIRDVNPVMTKLGCNAGTCHGAKEGKYGFKLSLRGYDPHLRRALAQGRSRRPPPQCRLARRFAHAPEGHRRRAARGRPADASSASKYYEILRSWIADGAKLDLKAPRVTKIEVFPRDPVVQQIGSRQQVRVVATYTDGKTRDVTAEAFVESGNTDVAKTDGGGLDRHPAPRRSAAARPLRGQLRRHHAHRDGRPHRLRLAAAGDLEPHRRTRRREMGADENPAFRAVHRRGIPAPRVSRSHRPAAHRGGSARLHRRDAARRARSATRSSTSSSARRNSSSTGRTSGRTCSR